MMPTAVNGIAAASATNTKAIKSKNQLRRAKVKQKKAAAASSETTPARLSFLHQPVAGCLMFALFLYRN